MEWPIIPEDSESHMWQLVPPRVSLELTRGKTTASRTAPPSLYFIFQVKLFLITSFFVASRNPLVHGPVATLSNRMFTSTRLQAVTYLLGVCLFSIAFLVFLNSTLSFVITRLIKQRTHIGDAVGTLGFADELVALVACPAWGVISDRLGVRTVGSLLL